jgi:hypothetical protein
MRDGELQKWRTRDVALLQKLDQLFLHYAVVALMNPLNIIYRAIESICSG